MMPQTQNKGNNDDTASLRRELQIKNQLLEGTLQEFARTTAELGKLEHQLAFMKIDECSGGNLLTKTNTEERKNTISNKPHSLNNISQSQSHTNIKNSIDINDSLEILRYSNIDHELLVIQNELQIITEEEDVKRKIHNQYRNDLQESWDKLVNLRSHILTFQKSIDEAALEEARSYASGHASMQWETPASASQGSSQRSEMTLESTYRLADLQILQQKLPLREALRERMIASETRLKALREELDVKSDSLTRCGRELGGGGGGSSMGGGSSGVDTGGGGMDLISRSMDLRQSLMAVSRELEEAESEYVRSSAEFEIIESELTRCMRGMSLADTTTITGASSNRGGGGGTGTGRGDGIDMSKLYLDTSGYRTPGLHHTPSLGPDIPPYMYNTNTTATSSDNNVNNNNINNNPWNISQNSNSSNNMSGALMTIGVGMGMGEGGGGGSSLGGGSGVGFSLHEVLGGHAMVRRLNGEHPYSYRTRLEARLVSLGVLEGQCRVDVEAAAELVRKARDELRDCEVRRLRVSLQLAHVEGLVKQRQLEAVSKIMTVAVSGGERSGGGSSSVANGGGSMMTPMSSMSHTNTNTNRGTGMGTGADTHIFHDMAGASCHPNVVGTDHSSYTLLQSQAVAAATQLLRFDLSDYNRNNNNNSLSGNNMININGDSHSHIPTQSQYLPAVEYSQTQSQTQSHTRSDNHHSNNHLNNLNQESLLDSFSVFKEINADKNDTRRPPTPPPSTIPHPHNNTINNTTLSVSKDHLDMMSMDVSVSESMSVLDKLDRMGQGVSNQRLMLLQGQEDILDILRSQQRELEELRKNAEEMKKSKSQSQSQAQTNIVSGMRYRQRLFASTPTPLVPLPLPLKKGASGGSSSTASNSIASNMSKNRGRQSSLSSSSSSRDVKGVGSTQRHTRRQSPPVTTTTTRPTSSTTTSTTSSTTTSTTNRLTRPTISSAAREGEGVVMAGGGVVSDPRTHNNKNKIIKDNITKSLSSMSAPNNAPVPVPTTVPAPASAALPISHTNNSRPLVRTLFDSDSDADADKSVDADSHTQNPETGNSTHNEFQKAHSSGRSSSSSTRPQSKKTTTTTTSSSSSAVNAVTDNDHNVITASSKMTRGGVVSRGGSGGGGAISRKGGVVSSTAGTVTVTGIYERDWGIAVEEGDISEILHPSSSGSSGTGGKREWERDREWDWGRDAIPLDTSLKEQIQRCKLKLKLAKVEENLDTNSGIGLDDDGCSTAQLTITVSCARDLPEMKRSSKTADPFVEMWISNETEGDTSQPPPLPLPRGKFQHHDEQQQHRVRTSTKWNTRYPQWRERLTPLPVCTLGGVLCVVVWDATKQGNDHIIGHAALPLYRLLDQRLHTYWLRLRVPVLSAPEARSRPRIDPSCAVRVDVKLTYSKIAMWMDRLQDLEGVGVVVDPDIPSIISTKITIIEDKSKEIEIKKENNNNNNDTDMVVEDVDGEDDVNIDIEYDYDEYDNDKYGNDNKDGDSKIHKEGGRDRGMLTTTTTTTSTSTIPSQKTAMTKVKSDTTVAVVAKKTRNTNNINTNTNTDSTNSTNATANKIPATSKTSSTDLNSNSNSNNRNSLIGNSSSGDNSVTVISMDKEGEGGGGGGIRDGTGGGGAHTTTGVNLSIFKRAGVYRPATSLREQRRQLQIQEKKNKTVNTNSTRNRSSSSSSGGNGNSVKRVEWKIN
eukprot:gene374-683_t